MLNRKYVKNILGAGIAASLYFPLVVVAGMLVRKGFNPFSDVISSLYEAGSPYGVIFQIAFILYNVFLAIFGISVCQSAAYAQKKGALARVGGITILLSAFAGVIDDLTPQDPVGNALTLIGQLHWISTGIAFLLMVTSILLLSICAGANCKRKIFPLYSFITFFTVLAAGMLSSAGQKSGLPNWGMFETIVMATYLLWISILSRILKASISASGAS
jgi:hypothetical membrane protein